MTQLVLDHQLRHWREGRVIAGGAPWRLSRLAPSAAHVITTLSKGPADSADFDPRAIRALTSRGVIHPVARASEPMHARSHDVTIVIPVYQDAAGLGKALKSVRGFPVIVVDDGSAADEAEAIARIARDFGADLIRNSANAGPAAARNSGSQVVATAFIAFLDSDCQAESGWPQSALPHFEDSDVALVAPRILSSPSGNSVIDRYESLRGSLDLGDQPALVRPGSRVGYLPGAALVMRTETLADNSFDELMRVGEDVDFVWRLSETGSLVRFDPSSTVTHRNRPTFRRWLKQRFIYGTSVGDLDSRHPGRLAPWQPAAFNIASLALAASGHPFIALVPISASAGLIRWRLGSTPRAGLIATHIAVSGGLNDARGLGQALRREWWPIGASACALFIIRPRTRVTHLALATMAIPVIADWWSVRKRMPLGGYTAMRALDDMSYGTGVITSAIKNRQWRLLAPRPGSITIRRGRSDRRALAP